MSMCIVYPCVHVNVRLSWASCVLNGYVRVCVCCTMKMWKIGKKTHENSNNREETNTKRRENSSNNSNKDTHVRNSIQTYYREQRTLWQLMLCHFVCSTDDDDNDDGDGDSDSDNNSDNDNSVTCTLTLRRLYTGRQRCTLCKLQ